MRRKRAAPASQERSSISRSRTKSNAGAENAATKNPIAAIGQKCRDRPMPRAFRNGTGLPGRNARLSGRKRLTSGKKSRPTPVMAKRSRQASGLFSARGRSSRPVPTPSDPARPYTPIP